MIFANEAGFGAESRLRKVLHASGVNNLQWREKTGKCGTEGHSGNLFCCKNGES